MRRTTSLGVALGASVAAAAFVFVITAATSNVLASGAHVLTDPTCTISGTSITCTGGSAAGLGNQAVTVSASCPGGCSTNKNNNNPPGHLQFGSQPIQPNNGRINFPSFTLSADCPNGLTAFIGNIVTYTITSSNGKILLQFQVTAS